MLQLTVTSIQSERSRQYETEQVYFFYKVFSRFYVFRRDPCGGIPPVYIEAAGKILFTGTESTVLADADHFRIIRDLRAGYRISAQKNDENCGKKGMFCG